MTILPSYVNTARRLVLALLVVAGCMFGWTSWPATAAVARSATENTLLAPNVAAAIQRSMARAFTGRRDIAGDRWPLFRSRQVAGPGARSLAAGHDIAAVQGEAPVPRPSALAQQRPDTRAYAALPCAATANAGGTIVTMRHTEQSDQSARRTLFGAKGARFIGTLPLRQALGVGRWHRTDAAPDPARVGGLFS